MHPGFATLTVTIDGSGDLRPYVIKFFDPATRELVPQADKDRHDSKLGKEIMDWIDAQYRTKKGAN